MHDAGQRSRPAWPRQFCSDRNLCEAVAPANHRLIDGVYRVALRLHKCAS